MLPLHKDGGCSATLVKVAFVAGADARAFMAIFGIVHDPA